LVYLDSGTGNSPGEMGDRLKSLQTDGTARDSKLMWALGNYSRFVRPEMVRIEAQPDDRTDLLAQSVGLQVSAYKELNGLKIVLVIVNHNANDQKISLDGLQTKGRKIKMYVTDQARNLAKTAISPENISIPARAVSTIVVSAAK
jgi:O-glycosyl hydrolase